MCGICGIVGRDGAPLVNPTVLERMNRAIEATNLRPVIDRVFDIEQAAEAYRYQQSPALFGKVVIRV